MSKDELIITGARQNNLRSINLRLPHNKVIVITGVSGSGKSSFAFDPKNRRWQSWIERLRSFFVAVVSEMEREATVSVRTQRVSFTAAAE